MGALTTQEIRVRQLMTQRVHTISSDATLLRAMTVLRRYHVSGLPVTNGRHRVVGVISEKDIAKSLSEAGSSMTPEGLLEVFIHSRSHDTFLMSARDDPANPMHIFHECLQSVKVGDVMSLDPVVIAPDAPLDVAAKMMRERRINRLPVVEGDRLVGILTRHDVLSSWP